MKRQYSINKIKKAGRILSRPQEYEKEDLAEAEQILTYWRTIHFYPINTFQSTLRDKIKRLKLKNTFIGQRLKRVDSIIRKLQRFRRMKLSTMQDIAGIRAILNNIDEVRSLENDYRKTNFKHILKNSKDYISNPDSLGYRGVHLIYEYKVDNIERDGLLIELQIRTKLQHIWATAVEIMGTFEGSLFKAGEGEKKWLDYFKWVSMGFALLEDCPVCEDFKDIPPKQIFQKILEDTKKLQVYDKLKAFSISAQHIDQFRKNKTYHLITLKPKARKVGIESYSKKMVDIANQEYTKREKDIENENLDWQVVLVSTGRIGSLKKEFPNYFLDSRDFIKKINLIEAELLKL